MIILFKRSFLGFKYSNGVKLIPSANIFETKYEFYQGGKKKSFWNDIDMKLEGDLVNCVVEIPKEQSHKIQLIKEIDGHVFMQDTRKNIYTKQKQLRYYAQFPIFNYGYIPQTWQQNVTPNQHGLMGDDDPIDICQIGSRLFSIGQVVRTRIIGSFCLIDEGQIDWKVILLNQQESKERNISNIKDVNPRYLNSLLKWFKQIKTYDGKSLNTIAYDEKIFNKQETFQIIKKMHQNWKQLINSPQTIYAKKRAQFHINRS